MLRAYPFVPEPLEGPISPWFMLFSSGSRNPLETGDTG
jgi:hypothetical protein